LLDDDLLLLLPATAEITSNDAENDDHNHDHNNYYQDHPDSRRNSRDCVVNCSAEIMAFAVCVVIWSACAVRIALAILRALALIAIVSPNTPASAVISILGLNAPSLALSRT
jgi:hypothetical protein